MMKASREPGVGARDGPQQMFFALAVIMAIPLLGKAGDRSGLSRVGVGVAYSRHTEDVSTGGGKAVPHARNWSSLATSTSPGSVRSGPAAPSGATT
jgi:hypothetical protein